MSMTARYTVGGTIIATIDGVEMTIPNDTANRHYAALIASGVAITPYSPPIKTAAQARASVAIDRALFCNRLADYSVLTDAEAISAAKGDWPAAMLFFLGYLTAPQQRDAQITWASCATVERSHWLVLTMISIGIVTDAVADAIFGIAE